MDARVIEQACNKFPDLPPRAACIADFIETYCTLSKGGHRGKPFKLVNWQFESLAGMYPGNPGDPRVITRAFISIARKNGKSEFCSALVLAHLCGPEAGIGQEIICAAAASQEQAELVWDGARIMARNHPVLNAGMTYRQNRLIWKMNEIDNYAHAVSTKESSLQGKIPSLFVMDEFAETSSRAVYESLNLADSADATGGMGILISTRSTMPNSLFSILYDEIEEGKQQGDMSEWYCKVWSADPTSSNVLTMEQVEAANPAIDVIVNRASLERKLRTAITSETARADFRSRILNIQSGTHSSLVDPMTWDELGIPLEPRASLFERMKGKRAMIGIDLGSTRSMTAVAVYWPDDGLVSATCFMARSMVKKMSTLHKFDYQAQADAGRLILTSAADTGGMSFRPVAEFVVDLFRKFNILSFRYDPWRIPVFFHEMAQLGMKEQHHPLLRVKDPFRQGPMSWTPVIDEFDDKVAARMLRHDSDPVAKMCVNVCQVEVVNKIADETRALAKNKQRLPNDAAVAILMAISNRGVFEKNSVLTTADIEKMYTPPSDTDTADDNPQMDIVNAFYGR